MFLFYALLSIVIHRVGSRITLVIFLERHTTSLFLNMSLYLNV
ncbi:MAG: hypothetical protein ACEY29_02885 [Arsenophonus sp.]